MSEQNDDQWSKSLIKELATDALKERRRSRRWGIFFKTLTFAYLIGLLYVAMPDTFDFDEEALAKKDHVALVDLEGEISTEEGENAEGVVKGLRAAYKDDHTKAIIIRINSPGGLPVQASYMQKEIKRLKAKHPDIPVYAVVQDMAASGGYYVAAAADKIYVNESSLVGSIGVIMNGFGFTGAMDKLGIERRMLTAGKNKGILDPFSPLTDEQRAHAQATLDELHQTFIDVVKEGRGDRLSDDPDLFSGLFWSGKKAIELGLADDIGSAGTVARDVIGLEVVKNFTPEQDPIERLAQRFGASVGQGLGKVMGQGFSIK